MDRRLVLALLIVLAGCGGGGGGGSDPPDRSLEIVNHESIEHSVQENESVSVRADADGDDFQRVELSYTVRNRSGAVVTENTTEMSRVAGFSNRYAGEIPGQPPGYDISYEVRAVYDSAEKVRERGYRISMVEAHDGPDVTADGDTTTSNVSSEITVRLATTSDVERVVVEYNRTLKDRDDEPTKSGQVVVTNVTDENVSVDIVNERTGEKTTKVDVSYHIRVEYGDGVNYTYRTVDWEYAYRNDREDVLVVPVMFASNSSSTNVSRNVTPRLRNVSYYYNNQSNGQVDLGFEYYFNSSDKPYFVVPGDPHRFLNRSADDPYKHGKLDCAIQRELASQGDVAYSKYRSVVFVIAEIDNVDLRGLSRPPGATSTDALDGEYDCGSSPAGQYHVLISQDENYGTYAHELGHSVFHWWDYYGRDYQGMEFGKVRAWGLMGAGGNREGQPSQVMAYHRRAEGWAEEVELPSVSEDRPRATARLRYARAGGKVAEYRVDLIDGFEQHPLFTYYLFEARDPGNNPLPNQSGQWVHSNSKGSGIEVYGVTSYNTIGEEIEGVNALQNPEQGGTYRTVSLRSAGDTTIYDPDAGLAFEADPMPGGAKVRVRHYEPSNMTGVSMYALLDCGTNATSAEDCSDVTLLTPKPNDTGIVPAARLQARTPNGTVGIDQNGTVHRVGGSRTLIAGSAQEVFVPMNETASYFVNVSAIDLDGGSATLVIMTRTVTRDENGTRTASTFEPIRVNETKEVRPELARLNATNRLEMGQLRTLGANETTLRIANNGIRALENVSVDSDSGWISVGTTDIGTIPAASASTTNVTVTVPGGTPVGTYRFNLTVTGNGTRGNQTDRVPVTLTVLPTAHWNAKTEPTNTTIAANDTVVVTTTVENSNASNVPLYDVYPAVTGNVTRFNVTAPAGADSLSPGETARFRTTISVPAGGIEEGRYDGSLAIEPLKRYGRYFEYPVSVPSEYVATSPAERRMNLSVTAEGPGVGSSATFHPDRQTAMRKGATTERVLVDVTDGSVPARNITIDIGIPDGWALQHAPSAKQIDVYVITQNRGNGNGKVRAGGRTQLDRSDYEVERIGRTLRITVRNVSNTTVGTYLNRNHSLEAEFKLNKNRTADSYEYSSPVHAVATSPIGVYRSERTSADIHLFDPPNGAPPTRVGNTRSRVRHGAIRVGSMGIGRNATLTAAQTHAVVRDGETEYWTRFVLQSDDRNAAKHVWLPTASFRNATHEVVVVDGRTYAAVDAVLTRDTQGSKSSALRNGKGVTLYLPVDVPGERVEVANLDATGNGSVVLTNSTGANISRVAVTAPELGNMSADGRIDVVVGEGVFSTERPRSSGNESVGGTVDHPSLSTPEVRAEG